MFREFLVYHNDSLEFRAKVLTLMVLADDEINECEEKLLREISGKIYPDNHDRAEILIETVHEYYDKIKANNALAYDNLISQIIKDVKYKPRFVKKIDIETLKQFHQCQKDEEYSIFQDRIIEFLIYVKNTYG